MFFGIERLSSAELEESLIIGSKTGRGTGKEPKKNKEKITGCPDG